LERLTEALAAALAEVLPAPLQFEALAANGESLATIRVSDGAEGRWVAKRMHPELVREAAAYTGPLTGGTLAPSCRAVVEDAGGGRWLLLEDAGESLAAAALPGLLDPLATLAAELHDLPSPVDRRFWRRPVHVVHDRRHLLGELRIAFERLRRAEAEGILPAGFTPRPNTEAAVLEPGWRTPVRSDTGFVHGDFTADNVLRGADGRLRAVDFSQWGRGPRLWDLTAMTLDLDDASRRRFVEAYLGRRRSLDPTLRNAVLWTAGMECLRPPRLLIVLGAICAAGDDDSPGRRERLNRRLDQWEACRCA